MKSSCYERHPFLSWGESISPLEHQITDFKYRKDTYDSDRKSTSSESSLEYLVDNRGAVIMLFMLSSTTFSEAS